MALTRLARRMRQESAGGVSPTLNAALATLDRLGPMTLGELAAAEQVQPPTMTRAVDRLVAEGLVQRLADARDRRVIRVRLTPAGKRLVAATRRRKDEYLTAQLQALSASERALLARAVLLLERLVGEEARP